MAVVDHDHGVVFFREVADAFKIGDDAIHGEHTVGGDQAEAAVFRLLQPGFEIGHVVVGVAETLGLRQPHTVDDRGMVQRIGNDRILLAEQCLEQAAIGVEAGAVEDGVVHAEE
ncbi:hypothetical protein X764_27755 [Mesorhizobium sp. LSHC440A00]|nr:hypothetical protein X764_27755 [Mesorhizobium sp. LSHC440A00]